MRRVAIRAGAVVVIGLVLASVSATSAVAASRSAGGLHVSRAHWGGSHRHHGGHWHRHWRGGYGYRGWGYRPWGWYPGGFAVGFGVGAAVASPWWAYPRVYAPVAAYPAYPYPYPAYGYPPPATPYPYPAYPPPPPPPPPPAPEPEPVQPGSSAPLAPTPELQSSLTAPAPSPGPPPGATTQSPPAQPSAGACETVTVVGHWQTRVYPDGQRLSVWVPTQSTCR